MNSKETRIKQLEGLLRSAWRLMPDRDYHDKYMQAEQKAWEVNTAAVLNAADALSQQAEPAQCPFCDASEVVELRTKHCLKCDADFAGAEEMSSNKAAVLEDRENREPAPAQDEREAFEGWTDQQWPGAKRQQLERNEYGQYKNSSYRDFWTGWQARATRPAQKVNNVDTPEQQPCGYQYQTPDGDWFPIAKSMIAEAEEHGHKVRSVYAAPIAQAEQQPEQSNEA